MNNKVYLKRDFSASAERVFEALTDPQIILRWFGPKDMRTVEARVDLKVGGMYQYHIERTDKSKFYIEGEFLEIDQPNKLVYTSEYRDLPEADNINSVITINLKPNSGGTELRFVQEFSIIPDNMASRTVSWEKMFDRLAAQL